MKKKTRKTVRRQVQQPRGKKMVLGSEELQGNGDLKTGTGLKAASIRPGV